MKKLTDTEISEIIKLYSNGMAPKDIGLKFNIANNSVTRILRRNNVERNQLTKVDLEIQQLIIQQYAIDPNAEKIARNLGIDGTTVCRILKRHNITLQPRSNQKSISE